jgi:hypothetical protein
MPLTPEHEYELRDRELSDAREYKLAELDVRKTEVRRSPLWTATFAAAVIAAAVAIAGHWVVSQKNHADIALARLEFDHKQDLAKRDFEYKAKVAGDEFCYKVFAEAMTRNRGQATERIANEVNALASLVDLGRYCNGDLREFADRMRSQRADLSALEASQAPTLIDGASEPSESATPSSAPKPTCLAIKSIRELGWKSGHKTNFCRERGYDGVHNPFGNYSAGGSCFRGDAAVCISEIERR